MIFLKLNWTLKDETSMLRMVCKWKDVVFWVKIIGRDNAAIKRNFKNSSKSLFSGKQAALGHESGFRFPHTRTMKYSSCKMEQQGSRA